MASTAKVDAELHRLEQSLLDPLVRRSRARVSRLLAEDFVEFGASGTVYDKRSVLEAMACERPAVVAISDLKARSLSPELFLVTFRATRFDESGQPVDRSLRSSLWQRSEGEWQLRFHQGTGVPLR